MSSETDLRMNINWKCTFFKELDDVSILILGLSTLFYGNSECKIFFSFLPVYKIWTVSICICHDPGFWTKHFSFGLSASVWYSLFHLVCCSFSVFSFSNIKLFLRLCFHSYSVCIVIFSVILQACFPSSCVPWV